MIQIVDQGSHYKESDQLTSVLIEHKYEDVHCSDFRYLVVVTVKPEHLLMALLLGDFLQRCSTEISCRWQHNLPS